MRVVLLALATALGGCIIEEHPEWVGNGETVAKGNDDDDDSPSDTGLPDLDCAAYPTALACDGFEGSLPGLWTLAAGTIGPTREIVYAGEHALHIGPDSGVLDLEIPEPLAAGTTIFIRAYLFVPQWASIPEWIVVAGLAGVEFQGLEKISFDLADDDRVAIAHTTTFPDSTDSLPGTLRRNQWTCVELEVEIGETGRAELRLDDVPVVVVPELDTIPMGGAQSFEVGGYSHGPVELYLDNVVIDVVPIGCD